MIEDNQFLGLCWAIFDKRDKRTYLVGLTGEASCTCGLHSCSHVRTVEARFVSAFGLPGDDDLPELDESEPQVEPELKKRRGRRPKAA